MASTIHAGKKSHLGFRLALSVGIVFCAWLLTAKTAQSCECLNKGKCQECELVTRIVGDKNQSHADTGNKKKIWYGDVPFITQLDHADTNWWRFEFMMGHIRVCLNCHSPTDDSTGEGEYKSDHSDFKATIKFDPDQGYTLSHNGYYLEWVEWSGQRVLVTATDPDGKEIFGSGSVTYGSDQRPSAYTMYGVAYVVTYANSNDIRDLRHSTRERKVSGSSATASKTQHRYGSETGTGAVLRDRETTIDYNSDGSKRVLTTINGYYGSSEGNKSNQLKFVLTPEGVRRYFLKYGSASFVDPDHPENSCSLDTASDADLIEFASAVYYDYDSSGRPTRTLGEDCASCGAGGAPLSEVLTWYDDSGSGTETNYNTWKYSKKAVTVDPVTDPAGDPLGLASVAEYSNAYGQMIYRVECEIGPGPNWDIGRTWVTHYVYDKNETNYGDTVPRLIQVRHPSACTGYTTASDDKTYQWSVGNTRTYKFKKVTDEATSGTAGLVELNEYYVSNGSGGYKGQLQYEKVREGISSGQTTYRLRQYTYLETSYKGSKVYHLASLKEYTDGRAGYLIGNQTDYTYQFYQDGANDMHAVEFMTVQYPEVTHNGPPGRKEVIYHYNKDASGNYWNDWTKHEDLTLSYTHVNSAGQVDYVVTDVKTDTQGFPAAPVYPPGTTWSNTAGLHLKTEYAFYGSSDSGSFGQPKSVKRYTATYIYLETRYAYTSTDFAHDSLKSTYSLATLEFPFVDSSGSYGYLPVRITVTDLDGRTVVSAQGVPADASDSTLLSNNWDRDGTVTGDFTAWKAPQQGSRTLTERTGYNYKVGDDWYSNVQSTVRWTDADNASADKYTTYYGYDPATGQQVSVKEPNGTITYNQCDALGRSIATWMGTNDTDATQRDPSNGGAGGNDLVKGTQTFYDEADGQEGGGTSGTGDGHVTCSREWWGTSSGNHYATLYKVDYRGRTVQTRQPNMVTTKVDLDDQGRETTVQVYAEASTPSPNWSIDSGELFAKSVNAYDERGALYQTQVYSVASNGTATLAYTSKFYHDSRSRTVKTQERDGVTGATYSKTIFDGAGRPWYEAICSDEGANTDPWSLKDDTIESLTKYIYDNAGRIRIVYRGATITYDGNGSIVDDSTEPVHFTWYDTAWNGSGSLRPYATGVSTVKAVDTYDWALTKYEYDSAGRRQWVKPPVGPWTKNVYDDLGRVKEGWTYDQDIIESKRLSKQTREYNGTTGLLETEKVFKVAADGTPAADFVATGHAYESFGGLNKITQPAGAYEKTEYNLADQMTRRSLYADDTTVLTETLYDYKADGALRLTTTYQRNHDNTSTTGLLSSGTYDMTKSRRTFQAAWYDKAGRVSTTADYGTNGGSGLASGWYDTEPSTGTSTTIVAKFEYDGLGRQEKATNNNGKITRHFYDDLGQPKYVVENYLDGQTYWTNSPYLGPDNGIVSHTGSADVNRIAKYTYNNLGQVASLTAVDPDANGNQGDNQVTTYDYSNGSDMDCKIRRKDLVVKVTYPDSTGSSDAVSIRYMADGQVKTRTDQRNTVHTYYYDDGARLTRDDVTTLGGADDYVQSIVYAYEKHGQLEKITSRSDVTGGSGVVRNEVKLEYSADNWGRLSKSSQAHVGTVDGNTYHVDYAFDAATISGNQKNLRFKQLIYPNGRTVHYNYGTGAGAKLNRVENLASEADTTDNAKKFGQYAYLGSATPVELSYPAVSGTPRLTRLKDSGSGTDPYQTFDRFGRVTDQWWKNSSADLDRFTYGYDNNSNRTWRQNEKTHGATPNLDEAYSYDGLDRLKKVNRGTLASGTITDANATFAQTWGLDGLGNWPTFTWDNDGYGGDSAVQQSRTHNEVDEIFTERYHGATGGNAISGSGAADWANPSYDAAGNMISAPKPGDEANHSSEMVYDAWNRLVEVRADDDSTVIAQYRYDGERKRIAKLVPNQTNTSNWDRTDFYYSANWQVLEERVAADITSANKETPATTVRCQYVWDIRYVDAPVCRDDNTDPGEDTDCMDTDEGGSRHLFYTHDANFNVTALIDGSDGAVVERYRYDPYGKPFILHGVRDAQGNNTTEWSARSTNTFANAILFCGYYYDAESGLYQVRNRYYHSTGGRWIQRDTGDYLLSEDRSFAVRVVEYHDGMNMSAYARSSPITGVDPYGSRTIDLGPLGKVDIPVPTGTCYGYIADVAGHEIRNWTKRAVKLRWIKPHWTEADWRGRGKPGAKWLAGKWDEQPAKPEAGYDKVNQAGFEDGVKKAVDEEIAKQRKMGKLPIKYHKRCPQGCKCHVLVALPVNLSRFSQHIKKFIDIGWQGTDSWVPVFLTKVYDQEKESVDTIVEFDVYLKVKIIVYGGLCTD